VDARQRRRGVPGGRDARPPPPARRRQFDLALRSAVVFSPGRERSKTTVVTALHAFRVAALGLARRAVARGAPDDLATLWLVTAEEFDDYLGDPRAFADVQEERAARRDELADLLPPFVFVDTQPPPPTWTSRSGAGVGAQMSHAVMVGRELGIPCVVSVTGATTAIPDGALLEVDGSSGTVTVLAAS
jgi:rifampicin phosphotransferase